MNSTKSKSLHHKSGVRGKSKDSEPTFCSFATWNTDGRGTDYVCQSTDIVWVWLRVNRMGMSNEVVHVPLCRAHLLNCVVIR